MLTDPFFSDVYSRRENYVRKVPYNLIKLNEYKFYLELNVAGFDEKDIEIDALKNKLTVSSKSNQKDERDYVVNGISRREFKNVFTLLDNVEVREAKIKNGILTINMEVVVPEEERARKIMITH